MHTHRETRIMRSLQEIVPEHLRLRCALLGIKVELHGQHVFFVIPATIGTMTFNAGEDPSEPRLDHTFNQARRALDGLRGHRE
jgi:hypothetical protein